MPVVYNKAPVSNLERQRQFRARNPHYYRDLHRKRKAEAEAFSKLRAAHPELTDRQICAIVKGTAPAPGSSNPAPRKAATPQAPPRVQDTLKQPLLLPAVAQSHRTVAVNLPQPVILIKTPPAPRVSRRESTRQ